MKEQFHALDYHNTGYVDVKDLKGLILNLLITYHPMNTQLTEIQMMEVSDKVVTLTEVNHESKLV